MRFGHGSRPLVAFSAWLVLALGAALAWTPRAQAAPFTPSDDAQIVETLPSVAGWSLKTRRLKRELLQRPRDEATALEAATAYLDLARSQGDARYAGHSLGVLQAWEPLTAATPERILVMHATVTQFLHEFDRAESTLRLAIASHPDNAQAWLTLATLQRLRGRFAESDTSCRSLGALRQNLYALACLAENAALRGEPARARDTLRGLLASPAMRAPDQGASRAWLLTTLAEVEELAGRPDEAETAYREALKSGRDGYDQIAYADFLLARGRPAEVGPLLAAEARSDAVLLRLVIAARRSAGGGNASFERDRAELQARFDAAAERPGAAAVHAREQALFALDVRDDPAAALRLARLNVELQREPVDLVLLARAATAAGDAAARDEVRSLMQRIGLRDARVDAVLASAR
ncbi:MAG: hypothetical protein EOO24_07510 [Comamonadaceae bacterium]|nr:MAG: hypothetical protein EOO24_07510 [Comamonadaceae bacterium]